MIEPVIYERDEWQEIRQQHVARARKLTGRWLERRKRGEADPIEDFLYEYYSVKPAQLERWHPGPGILLRDAPEYAEQKWYTWTGDVAEFDRDAFLEARGRAVGYIEKLLTLILNRKPTLGCFGLHEWAMVYRQQPDDLRHSQLPLRLGNEGTDRVVEENPISCSHFDAFRFFTKDARPLNGLQPTRQRQEDFEQPGCLHAGMDNFKWAFKLGPAIPGDVLLDAFELAREIRYLDMQASPYDLRSVGEIAVKIETDAGKREYQRRQAEFAERGQQLRQNMLDALKRLTMSNSAGTVPKTSISSVTG